ncbi:putative GPI ethanolamine phosphate transferase [Zostera marina]|uniref:GPI ethanolamine phosphate transferase 1 n=1 Tax=Zostera marina TaxID=29655 RepID=A0A0K9PT16_ZOSMR|nr:putative GPI ethanolamine phosphate transferase [Zostera marina]
MEGNRDLSAGTEGRRKSATSMRDQVKRREIWLIILGIVLHALYMLSIFDIYFKTPIIHGMDPVPQRIVAPAKRLVLIIGDGLRADKFLEPDSEGRFRAPFLRSVIREKGRWGISHARPPTESRPGHVSIIAGFYEDPSAVTKGWKANPVEFDSVFNRSRHIFAFGSPDIIPIFCSSVPHSTWKSFPHELEDFASDASYLDKWSLDKFQSLMNESLSNSTLKRLLSEDKLVIFLHLAGCDTNGHAHRPYSSIYLNNVNVIDNIAKSVYTLMENYYNDNQTAYVFTSDHGISDKGSHGDGHSTNTETPLVAWGAGVQGPKQMFPQNQSDDGFHFVDEHKHDILTPSEWNLNDIERVDVNQADIAPLMATLVGLPCPVNSVGNLPLGYLKLTETEEVEADLANTKQILNQFLHKSYLKREHSFLFKPFKPLVNYSSIISHIEDLISAKDFKIALKLSQDLRSLSLLGFHYFQTYDWFMLMTTIILGYLGWMTNLLVHVIQSYTSLQMDIFSKKNKLVHQSYRHDKVYLGGFFFMVILSVLLFLEKSPLLYHAYFMMAVFLWTRIFRHLLVLKTIWKYIFQKKFSSFLMLTATCLMSIFILEFLVSSFSERKLYTWFFLFVGLLGALLFFKIFPDRPLLAIYVLAVCWLLSVFTLMPAEIPDNNLLVIVSGAFFVIFGFASRWFELNVLSDKVLSCIVRHDERVHERSNLFYLQAIMVLLSSMMVWLSTSHRTQWKELLFMHQIINWSLAGISMVLPLFSSTNLLARLTSIFLGFAPSFLLLSIGYEAVFYGALALVLMGWILVECANLYLQKLKNFPSQMKDSENRMIFNQNERSLELSDLRVPLIFMVLFNVAFFGTGNFASIASFEISSVYRFVTVFSPFLMTALLIFKLCIPYMLVICVFSAITKLIQLPRIGCYFLVILLSDVMTIHFFFLVRNTGSWMEIGNSISHFGIMSAQVVFLLFLFAITNIYTKNIQVGQHPSSQKMS